MDIKNFETDIKTKEILIKRNIISVNNMMDDEITLLETIAKSQGRSKASLCRLIIRKYLAKIQDEPNSEFSDLKVIDKSAVEIVKNIEKVKGKMEKEHGEEWNKDRNLIKNLDLLQE